MFGSMKSGTHAYLNVGVETGVLAASPHKLIVMLFEGAETAVRLAAQQMKNGDIPGKGGSISKAIMIIENGLRASLDKKAGGEIAANLDALYEYMAGRLLLANLNNAPDMLEEVRMLLSDLKNAWNAIGATTDPAAAALPQAPRATEYDRLGPRSSTFVSA